MDATTGLTKKDRAITVPLVLPMSWIDRLNALAADRGVARSALIRGAIEAGLFTDGRTVEKAGGQAATVAAGQ